MAQIQKQDMGTGSIKKWMVKLAVPAILGQLVNMLYNIVDRIYIGHIPENGDLALTGVGVCMPIITPRAHRLFETDVVHSVVLCEEI